MGRCCGVELDPVNRKLFQLCAGNLHTFLNSVTVQFTEVEKSKVQVGSALSFEQLFIRRTRFVLKVHVQVLRNSVLVACKLLLVRTYGGSGMHSIITV